MAASTSLDSQIRIWDVSQHSLIKAVDAGPMEAWALSFSPDGRHFATGTHSGKINIWAAETGEKDRVLDAKGRFITANSFVRFFIELPLCEKEITYACLLTVT